MTQNMLFSSVEMALFARHLPSPIPPADYQAPREFPPLSRSRRICIDIETHDPDLPTKGPGPRRGAYMVGVGVRTEDGEVSTYYPMRHLQGPNCDPDKVIEWLKDELNCYTGEIIGANVGLYDGDFLQCAGIRPQLAQWRDIQWAEALLDETGRSYHLNDLAFKYLAERKGIGALKALYGDQVMHHFREVHPAHAAAYSQPDIVLPFGILEKQLQMLEKEKLTQLFLMESRLTPLLLHMREQGVRVDLERAAALEKMVASKRDEHLGAMREIVGFEVDPDSGPSLARACEVLKVPYELTEKGNPSFGKEWLVKMAAKTLIDELVPELAFFKHLGDARRYEKARNPFLTNYILGSSINERIHAEFHPLRRADENGDRGTVSGRFSSSHPNLQNIPIRDPELGHLIRALFLPDYGYEYFSADYSQIEFRLIVNAAVIAKCEGADKALEMYQNDPKTDFHNMVVSLTGLERKYAKNINFGIAFTMGEEKLAQKLGLPIVEAKAKLAQYHERVPFVKAISEKMMEDAARNGHIKTLLGRRRRFNLWEPKSGKRGSYRDTALSHEDAISTYGKGKIKRAGLHRALNSYTQGGSADITKSAMLAAWDSGLIGPGGPLRLGLTVHDELSGSVERSARGKEALKELKHTMETAIERGVVVPILVEVGTGANWSESH